MEDKRLLDLSVKTNRSKGQTQFLFELCDMDFDKLVVLEETLKNNFVFYCPGNKKSVEKVLKMNRYGKSGFFKLSEFY